MNERIILVIGIRALGALFLLLALVQTVSFVPSLLMQSGAGTVIWVWMFARIIVAITMMRYAGRIASRIAEPDDDAGQPSSLRPQIWHGWLITCLAVFVIAGAGVRSVFTSLNMMVYSPAAFSGMGAENTGLAGLVAFQVLILAFVLYAAVRRPDLIFGKSDHGI